MKVPNGTEIYLSFGRRITIPVNPQEIKITYPSNNATYDVLGLGEIVVPKSPGLQEVSWESFFPSSNEDPYTNGTASPSAIIKTLTRAKKNKKTGRLIISRSELFDTNLRCIIEDFETRDKGGEPGDIYYSILLKEYRDYAPTTATFVQQPTATSEQLPDAVAIEAVAEDARPIETPVLRVGAQVVANGKYWYDSYGSAPFGTASNLRTNVTRIVSGNPYPIHIGHYGWLQEDQLQIVG